MAYSLPPFSQFVWQNYPSLATALSAQNLEADENNLAAYVQQLISGLDTYLESTLAPLNSPALTGTPTTPTAAPGTNTTQIASTAFVLANATTAGVATFNARTGAVVPASGDYTAAEVTNAADLSSVSQQAFAGEVAAPDFAPTGLTGATAAGRYVGSTIAGAPVSGTFAKGDWVTDQAGIRWTCTTAGAPGTWTQEPGTAGSGGTGAAGSGATLADAGRSGTIAAPVLRDFRSVKDTGYGAKGAGKSMTAGATTTATTTTFTDTTNSPFVSGDTGKTIIIPGAGTGGRNFSATITYVSSSQVTLSVAAVTSVSGTAYQYGWDDSTAITTALSHAGTIYFGNDTYLVSSAAVVSNSVLYGYGATIWHIPAGTLGGIFKQDNGQNGTTVSSNLWILGFNAHGEGQAGYTTGDQSTGIDNLAQLNQWQNITIRDCVCDGFMNAAIDVRDSQHVSYLFNTFSNCSLNAGRNVVNFADTSTGGSLPCTDFLATGNRITTGCQAAGIAIAISFRSQTFTDAVIVNNPNLTMTSSLACIDVEVNRSANGTVARRLIIANNVCDQQGTASNSLTCCIFLFDDYTANVSTSSTKVEDILIQGNWCTSSAVTTGGSDGVLSFYASRVNVTGNVFISTGSSGRCILMKPQGSDPSVMQWITFSHNQCHATSTGATENIVEFRTAQHVTWTGGVIESSSTTSGDALKIGAIQYWNIGGGLRIVTPANNGINLSAWKDGIIDGVVIYNANNANSATSSLGNGILYSGTAANLAGNYNALCNAHVYDDGSRGGGKQMLYGFQNSAGSATTKIHMDGVRITGAKTLPMNSSMIPATFSEFVNYYSDVMTGYGLDIASVTISANPTTIGPYPFNVEVDFSNVGTIGSMTYSRNSQALPAPAIGSTKMIVRGETLAVNGSTTGTAIVTPQI